MSLFDRLIGLVRKNRFHGPWICVCLGEELDDDLLRIVRGQTAQCRITIRQAALNEDGKERLRSLDARFQKLRTKFATLFDDPKSVWDDDHATLVTELIAVSNDHADWFRGMIESLPLYDSDEPNLTVRVECALRTF